MPYSLVITLLKIRMSIMTFFFKFLPQAKPILFTGDSATKQLCENIAHFGHKRVLIITDEILVKLGVIDPMKEVLTSKGVEVFIYDQVEPNPTFAMVEAGLAVFRRENCDAVLAVGGGSPIDTAKTIALAANNKITDAKKLAGNFKARRGPKPLYAVPTTAGTGSEVTLAAVITDPATHAKLAIADVRAIPIAAALDANIMKGMPPHVTAATGIDALTHAVESFIATTSRPATDHYSKAAVKMIFENLPVAYKDGNNLAAREAMAFASFYAGTAFSKTLLGYVHGIAHQFGGLYGTPHGLANALVLPHILDYSKDHVAARLAELAIAVGAGEQGEPVMVLAQKFIDGVYALNREVGIPETLEALKESDISGLATAALKESHFSYPVPKYMDQPTCENIIRKLLPVKKADASGSDASANATVNA